MTRSVRALAALVLAAGTVPLIGVTPAYAATSSEFATNSAYYFSGGVERPDQVPVGQVPNITGERLDGVAPGHLAVAVNQFGREDKRSFVAFDLASVPVGATINSATVTLPLAENSGENRQSNVDPALVQACPADDSGFAGEDGAPLINAPQALCDQATSPATASADGKAFVFDVTTMATAWLTEGNNGMAMIFAKATPFQVVFLPADQVTLDIDYTDPAEDLAGTFTETPATFDTGSTGTDAGTTDLSGGFDSGSTTGTDSSAGGADSGGFASLDAPVSAPAPESAADTSAAPEVATAPTATRRVGRVSEVLDPTASFLFAGLVLAGVLALLSLIMGDPQASSALATGRQSRLSQALSARQRAITR